MDNQEASPENHDEPEAIAQIPLNELPEVLRRVKEAQELLRPILQKELRTDVIWVSHARHAMGAIKDTISSLEKDIKRQKEEKYSNMF